MSELQGEGVLKHHKCPVGNFRRLDSRLAESSESAYPNQRKEASFTENESLSNYRNSQHSETHLCVDDPL